MNTRTFIGQKKKHKKWVMVTAYDTPTAEILDEVGVDLILVGDSVGTVVLGYSATTLVTMDEMIHHTKAVRRGIKNAKLIADLPLKGIEKGPAQAVESAKRFMGEAGCDAVKLEWDTKNESILKSLVRHKIPVMGHVGLTPQTARSGFKVRGKTTKEAFGIFQQARAFEKYGAFSVVLECVPSALAQIITRALKIPTIGIGAGRFCDGQVLVFQDLVGLFTKFKPKHVKRYAQGRTIFERSVRSFSNDVRHGIFPGRGQSFDMDVRELQELRKLL